MTHQHPAWLPDDALSALGRGTTLLLAADLEGDPVLGTVTAELTQAAATHGGRTGTSPDLAAVPDVVLATPAGLAALPDGALPGVLHSSTSSTSPLSDEGFYLRRAGRTTVVVATGARGLLYGMHEVARRGDGPGPDLDEVLEPTQPIRMLDHWDNLTVHPVMGQVERGYAGGSIFWLEGGLREDLSRVEAYARLLGSIGINRVAVNNVNVDPLEARLLTDGLADVARLADVFRPHGIRVHVSVSFGAPVSVGGLPGADPLDPEVQRWWSQTADDVWARIPDLGGFVVKADSEGQPGPFGYGRDHADGANLLARAIAPHGGTVFWRAFVYNHHQDWRDRSTDRARAAHDHFAPLDGRFEDNVVLQVKHGPLDFQTREAVSPVIAAMPRTRLAVELQVTQEYTGQQRHVCYLGPWWSQILRFQPWGSPGPTVADVAAGHGPGARAAGLVAVSNVGTDEFWTGHPLAQANLYAFGRLAWDATLDPTDVLDEWIRLTFGDDPAVASALHEIMDESWSTYEDYTAPLGVGFMVRPSDHYGPAVDGYEYSRWGTYHFADRDGIGVDRTCATGTGYTGQYPEPWREVYESLETCPDELLLFFHHVPYDHVLHSGTTVIQHIYDTHVRGVEQVEQVVRVWDEVADRVDPAVAVRVRERLTEQLRSAREWRDQIRTYFWRKSGVPDASGHVLY